LGQPDTFLATVTTRLFFKEASKAGTALEEAVAVVDAWVG
jgi:hypothetical protein